MCDMTPYERFMYLNRKTAFPLSAIIFFILTIIYIVFELVFNFTLIHQMSVQTTKETLDKVEIGGKVLAGIGIGLIFTKYYIDQYRHFGEIIIGRFILCALCGILISFTLQTLVIKTVVYLGSEEDKAKSLLIAQLNNTITPIYQSTNSSGLTPNEYFAASKECRDQGQGFKLESDNTLDKVIFPYQTLKQTFDEKKYIKIVTDYHKCLIPKTVIEKLPKPHLNKDVLTKAQIKKELYTKYKEMDNTYNQKVAEYKEAKSKRQLGFGQGRVVVKKIQEEWIKASKDLFGAESVVSPNLTQTQFYNHTDVKKKIDSLPSREVLEKQYQKARVDVFDRTLEDVIAPYTVQKELVEGVRSKTDFITKKSADYYQKMADDAYKSIVMPIIILFFSILFLLLNILSIFTFLVNRIETQFTDRRIFTKLSNYLVVGVLIWLITIPVFKKSELENANHFTNVVYFYEKILLGLKAEMNEKITLNTDKME